MPVKSVLLRVLLFMVCFFAIFDMASSTIKLPYTPAPVKGFLEAKTAFMAKLSSGEVPTLHESLSE